MSRRLRKRMIGASDGFDLNNKDADTRIDLCNIFARMFLTNLREKVTRGMKGAARRGTCLGKPGLGFTRLVCRDGKGEIVYRSNGQPRTKLCWDPKTRPYRALMYELFVKQNWSPYKIARHFNSLRVDGSDGWTGAAIKNLLKGTDAIGVFVWNRYHTEFDEEEGVWVTTEKPRSEWVVHKDPSLALVPKELWRAAWLKLLRTRKAHPLTGRKWSRNQKSATTLFSGTLFCGHCETELRLNRSAGKYKVMSCLSGSTGVHDCSLTTSKSVQIIEDCLLGFLKSSVFTEKVIEDLVKAANAFLEQEARKPLVDTAPMKAKLRDKQERIKKLVKKVEAEPDEALSEGYHARIKELQKEVNALKSTIADADAHNQPPPVPLDMERANAYLADLRELLSRDIPMAAEAIRTLTGPIRIRQEKVPGKRGARWIATFSPDLVTLLQKMAKDNGYPDVPTLSAIPSDPQPVSVTIDKIPRYEQLAPVFKQMRDNGASVQSIAHLHGMSWDYADQILKFADTGQRPKWGSGKGGGKGKAKPCIYKDIAPDVVRMRNEEEKPFEQIASILNVGLATVCRAYDFGCPDAVREAAEEGKKPRRGSSSRLGPKKFAEIRKLLGEGKKDAEVAATVGCGQSTVARTRRAMKGEADGEQAA